MHWQFWTYDKEIISFKKLRQFGSFFTRLTPFKAFFFASKTLYLSRTVTFLSATLLWYVVCVICNSKSFHSFLLKQYIMIVHTLKMCTFYFVQIWSTFFRGDIFPSEILRDCLFCVISDSNSFHSFILKLSIMIVHTLKMCTSYLMHI